MKKILLLLSTLIVVPAWAAEQTATPVQSAPDTRVNIELKGSAKSVSALVADIEKDAVYKEAACSTAKKPGKTAKITCAKADSALMTFLIKNAPAKVHWSISATSSQSIATPLASCPQGCVFMNCPPPNGAVVCCHKVLGVYTPC